MANAWRIVHALKFKFVGQGKVISRKYCTDEFPDVRLESLPWNKGTAVSNLKNYWSSWIWWKYELVKFMSFWKYVLKSPRVYKCIVQEVHEKIQITSYVHVQATIFYEQCASKQLEAKGALWWSREKQFFREIWKMRAANNVMWSMYSFEKTLREMPVTLLTQFLQQTTISISPFGLKRGTENCHEWMLLYNIQFFLHFYFRFFHYFLFCITW